MRARIDGLGIVPAIRVTSAEDALFAAEAVSRGGIPIVEVTMTVPGALAVVGELLRNRPEMTVGAGTVLDAETALRCVEAASPFSHQSRTVYASNGSRREIQHWSTLPGALTPTEIWAAWKAGADFVKVFPCATGWWAVVCTECAGSVPGGATRRGRGGESAYRRRLYPGRGFGLRHWGRFDSADCHPRPSRRLDHRIGPSLSGDRKGGRAHRRMRERYAITREGRVDARVGLCEGA